MKPVEVRGVRIGEGVPKICAPIVGRTKEEIIREAEELCDAPVDIAEWRADWFDEVFDWYKLEEILRELRSILGKMPLLFTFRTAGEGGRREAEPAQYRRLNKEAALTGYIDILDVEMFTGDESVKELVKSAHECSVKVIVSNHDFHRTPEHGELVKRLCHMQELGSDICKLAVMPESGRDVLTLLSATEEMVRRYADCPVITMSMSKMGIVSRLCGGLLGSAVTFGAVRKASAPGQIGVEELDRILEILHGQA